MDLPNNIWDILVTNSKKTLEEYINEIDDYNNILQIEDLLKIKKMKMIKELTIKSYDIIYIYGNQNIQSGYYLISKINNIKTSPYINIVLLKRSQESTIISDNFTLNNHQYININIFTTKWELYETRKNMDNLRINNSKQICTNNIILFSDIELSSFNIKNDYWDISSKLGIVKDKDNTNIYIKQLDGQEKIINKKQLKNIIKIFNLNDFKEYNGYNNIVKILYSNILRELLYKTNLIV